MKKGIILTGALAIIILSPSCSLGNHLANKHIH